MNKRLPSAKSIIKAHLKRTIKIKWENMLIDPRKKGLWTFGYIMQVLYYSIISGQKNLREVETFSENYNERLPDTTLYDVIVKIDANPLRKLLVKQVKEALRSHELDSKFPVKITAIDGKMSSISNESVGPFSQKIEDKETGKVKYYNRTLRAMFVSSDTKLFLGQREIHGKSSETTEFKEFLDELGNSYKNTKLLDVISVDAGMVSKKNADIVKKMNLNYIMALKGSQYKLHSNAEYIFDTMKKPTKITEEIYNGKRIIRHFFRTGVPTEYKNGWGHIKEFWKILKTVINLKTSDISSETRYFISSIQESKLNDEQVMKAIRMHWGIENNGFWLLDTAWSEDDSPFANKAFVLITLLRLISYNIISRLIKRRLRRTKTRKMSWKSIMELIRSSLEQIKKELDFQEYIYQAFAN